MTWTAGQREFTPLLLGLYHLLPPRKLLKQPHIEWVIVEEPEMGLHPQAITVFLLSLVIRARASKVVTGSAGLVGEAAIVHTALNPAGKVFVHGEYWDAVSSRPVGQGARVKINAVEGLVLKVEPE